MTCDVANEHGGVDNRLNYLLPLNTNHLLLRNEMISILHKLNQYLFLNIYKN